MKNWADITATSEHHAVLEIKNSFEKGDFQDVEEGLETLLEAMGRAEKRAVRSQLIRLMLHIIKWNIQSDKRSRSWLISINNARFSIEEEQEFSPSLSRLHIEELWDKALREAKKEAQIETGLSTKHIESLTWEEVFDKEYKI